MKTARWLLVALAGLTASLRRAPVATPIPVPGVRALLKECAVPAESRALERVDDFLSAGDYTRAKAEVTGLLERAGGLEFERKAKLRGVLVELGRRHDSILVQENNRRFAELKEMLSAVDREPQKLGENLPKIQACLDAYYRWLQALVDDGRFSQVYAGLAQTETYAFKDFLPQLRVQRVDWSGT